jgi:methylaspartate mutase epsilon subunit
VNPSGKHTVVLGGIGPDGHSVGITVLHCALIAAGFRTIHLGVQNRLDDFFRPAETADAVLISSLDGHARHYLRDFPNLRRRFGLAGPLWYVGGNLCAGTDDACAAHFAALGFDRVFVKFVDVATVLDLLRRDLRDMTPVCAATIRPPGPKPHDSRPAESTTMLRLGCQAPDRRSWGRNDRSRRLDAGDPLSERESVLEQWPSGALARSLDENARFLVDRPSLPKVQRAAAGHPLLQPRCGVGRADDQRRLMVALREAGAEVLSYQVDSLTRDNDYAAAAEALRSGVLLNGFPLVNHGVPVLRDIVGAIDVPLQTRHSTRDPRLLAEISFAGGLTAYEGGPISYNVPYHKHLQLRDSLARWAYVDQLTGLYFQRYGIRIDREFFGVLTGTLVPPSLAIAVDIIEMLLAVDRGVVSVTLGYAEQGNRVQDIAAIRVMRRIAERELRARARSDLEVFTAFHQYMAAFPASRERSAELIRASAATAALAGPTRILIKTAAEATGIPTVHDNIEAMEQVRQGFVDAVGLRPDQVRLAEEEELITREVDDILDSLRLCGGDDLAQGVIRGFGSGWLDIPFAPSDYNAGRVMTARDCEGAVRYLSVGNLQFGDDVRAFHERRIGERLRDEGLTSADAHVLVERDTLRVPRGDYQSWPLDG